MLYYYQQQRHLSVLPLWTPDLMMYMQYMMTNFAFEFQEHIY
ncbi:hypothetical protein AD29_5397 [Escherichia coli 2-222-05_S4_C3]|nr:hypothetical protein AD29_5397 [Escherichia coli 2-222-05_S4_C3]